MAFIDKFIWKKKPDKADTEPSGRTTDTVRYAIIDAEIGLTDHKIHDIAALRHDGAAFHKTSRKELLEFLKDTDYICGHNIIHHDAKYLFTGTTTEKTLVDTLYVSPLLFPERKHDILTLKSGDELYYMDSFLFCQPSHNPVVKLSRSMQDKLYDWDKKGYKVKAASVRFIVAWKPKDAPKKEADTAVILADIKLSRQPTNVNWDETAY